MSPDVPRVTSCVSVLHLNVFFLIYFKFIFFKFACMINLFLFSSQFTLMYIPPHLLFIMSVLVYRSLHPSSSVILFLDGI